MSKLKKWWKAGAVVVLALVTLQVAVSLLARTRRVHAYLTAHLERAFGRPVEVGSFGARIFPSLELYADGVTVGEDPAFGYEYFLRAEQLSAGLRWFGLLRGHFEFGTLSFGKSSLILDRSVQGRWNLERSRIRLGDRKSTRLNSSHRCISYAVFCLKKKNKEY